jgi:hypothetical protein
MRDFVPVRTCGCGGVRILSRPLFYGRGGRPHRGRLGEGSGSCHESWHTHSLYLFFLRDPSFVSSLDSRQPEQWKFLRGLVVAVPCGFKSGSSHHHARFRARLRRLVASRNALRRLVLDEFYPGARGVTAGPIDFARRTMNLNQLGLVFFHRSQGSFLQVHSF